MRLKGPSGEEIIIERRDEVLGNGLVVHPIATLVAVQSSCSSGESVGGQGCLLLPLCVSVRYCCFVGFSVIVTI